ncbi:unnamed protein product [Cercopithifilaria johnstoni]|uniref:Uncharacterized protein n=1 Tax=Cercopithifilaria johnstoni TaxID=2874296 RepID=A0A8J2Q254_9BILA|nr:unnamed protein product [Cercopithifilaria johnstoni]
MLPLKNLFEPTRTSRLQIHCLSFSHRLNDLRQTKTSRPFRMQRNREIKRREFECKVSLIHWKLNDVCDADLHLFTLLFRDCMGEQMKQVKENTEQLPNILLGQKWIFLSCIHVNESHKACDCEAVWESVWPSGLRRCVQVAIYSGRRRFESCGGHLLLRHFGVAISILLEYTLLKKIPRSSASSLLFSTSYLGYDYVVILHIS